MNGRVNYSYKPRPYVAVPLLNIRAKPCLPDTGPVCNTTKKVRLRHTLTKEEELTTRSTTKNMDSSDAPLRKKLVIVGDGACGKTSLLMYFSSFSQYHFDIEPLLIMCFEECFKEESSRKNMSPPCSIHMFKTSVSRHQIRPFNSRYGIRQDKKTLTVSAHYVTPTAM